MASKTLTCGAVVQLFNQCVNMAESYYRDWRLPCGTVYSQQFKYWHDAALGAYEQMTPECQEAVSEAYKRLMALK